MLDDLDRVESVLLPLVAHPLGQMLVALRSCDVRLVGEIAMEVARAVRRRERQESLLQLSLRGFGRRREAVNRRLLRPRRRNRTQRRHQHESRSHLHLVRSDFTVRQNPAVIRVTLRASRLSLGSTDDADFVDSEARSTSIHTTGGGREAAGAGRGGGGVSRALNLPVPLTLAYLRGAPPPLHARLRRARRSDKSFDVISNLCESV